MSKIYLEDFHFQPRRDTAENWNKDNPILCDGEFGVVTDSTDENWLKVGDGLTPWKQLSFKKGPKGDTGVKGDKGDPGKDAVTDRAYSPTSENAQSGKAVAEAVEKENLSILDILQTSSPLAQKVFEKVIPTLATSSWDVSANVDGSVMAYWCQRGTTDTYDLIIIGIGNGGAMQTFAKAANVPWNANRAKIKSVIVGQGVTSISKYSLRYLTAAENIYLSDAVSLKTIDEMSFYGYKTSLVGLPADTEIFIPASVETVGKQSFINFANSQILNFGKNSKLKTVGDWAFSNALYVSTAPFTIRNLPPTIENFGQSSFANCAFNEKISLTGAKVIKSWAFQQTGLNQEFSFADDVELNYFAFMCCNVGIKWKGSKTLQNVVGNVKPFANFQSQKDETVKDIAYAGSTISALGCVPCIGMMLINNLTNTAVTINDMIQDATDANAIGTGGTYTNIFLPYIANKYGLTITQLWYEEENPSAITQLRKQAIADVLSAGNWVVIAANSHAWILRGIDDKGNIYVADSMCPDLNPYTQDIDYVCAGTVTAAFVIET